MIRWLKRILLVAVLIVIVTAAYLLIPVKIKHDFDKVLRAVSGSGLEAGVSRDFGRSARGRGADWH